MIEKIPIIIGFDLSVYSSGFAVFSPECGLIDYGIISPEKFKGQSLLKYPEKAIRCSLSDVKQIKFLVDYFQTDTSYIDKILIEELNMKGRGSITANKSLAVLHGLVLVELIDYLPKIQMITSREWRNKLNIKSSDGDRQHNTDVYSGKIEEVTDETLNDKGLIDAKTLAIKMVNEIFDIDLVYEDNDIAEAICISLTNN